MVTLVGATPVSAGCQVVTSAAYPDDRHAPALALARRLVPTAYPLNGTAFGAASKTPAFLVEGDVTTGPRRDVVASKFVLLTSAAATGPTTGKATAAPIPGNSFTRVSPSPPACHACASCSGDLCACRRVGTAVVRTAAGARPVQYEFKLQPAGCRTCTPVTFPSSNASPSFTGLAPNTTVRGRRTAA